MRVIAGTAKSLPLKTIKGEQTRPTTDRIKETLFNMLSPDIPGCRFLDLFAGSGAIGIEALSRGAEKAVFVEKNREAAAVIRDNLRFTRLSDRAEVMQLDVVAAIHALALRNECFDVVFLDPPYREKWEAPVLMAISRENILSEEGYVVLEALLETELEEAAQEAGFEIIRDKRYKTNRHVFLQKKGMNPCF